METGITLAERVADHLNRLANSHRAEQRRDGLNPVQWEALRYLGRANRYSRSPSALTAYLGCTKGTISQTLITLERKGYLKRGQDPRDKRAVRIHLTGAGQVKLREDPLAKVTRTVTELDRTAQEALAFGLQALTDRIRQKQRSYSFGLCYSCRHFMRDAASGEMGGPHRCGITQEPLADFETGLICSGHDYPEK